MCGHLKSDTTQIGNASACFESEMPQHMCWALTLLQECPSLVQDGISLLQMLHSLALPPSGTVFVTATQQLLSVYRCSHIICSSWTDQPISLLYLVWGLYRDCLGISEHIYFKTNISRLEVSFKPFAEFLLIMTGRRDALLMRLVQQ